jgi:hypothetical protein
MKLRMPKTPTAGLTPVPVPMTPQQLKEEDTHQAWLDQLAAKKIADEQATLALVLEIEVSHQTTIRGVQSAALAAIQENQESILKELNRSNQVKHAAVAQSAKKIASEYAVMETNRKKMHARRMYTPTPGSTFTTTGPRMMPSPVEVDGKIPAASKKAPAAYTSNGN